MPDTYIVEHCSPTLAGLKTGSLFSVKNRELNDPTGELRDLNRLLTPKGLRAVPVRKTESHTLIYVYRPDRLDKDLNCPLARNILKKKGYICGNADRCVVQLIRRLTDDKDFPHEIGLFLGYPPSDVEGFMKDPDNGVKCIGFWKVYTNREKAEKTFAKFRKCTEVYCKELAGGRPLAQLIVSTC
ncbi:MAG: DUF3793 family protein [Lachnospiraceae bacterium]|nr:DUF3793 family protein [Lachnospiraceae bacterium]